MKTDSGHHSIPLSFNRRAVRASATVTSDKNVIHSLTQVDISLPRKLIRQHKENTGVRLSLTAYLVTCLGRTIQDHPALNSFIKGGRQVFLKDATVSVLVERELQGEKVPEPVAIRSTQKRSMLDISQDIRNAQKTQSDTLGGLSASWWLRLIPAFLLKAFVRLGDRSIRMAKRYGKLAVTSVGMFSTEAVWFVPHGSSTVLLTVGSIEDKVIDVDGHQETREYLCLTASFDHDIVDGAPAARFLGQFLKEVKSGRLIQDIM